MYKLDEPVIIVYLRQPYKSDPNESRDDPFWEFGSFGCTGCHERNLMNVNRLEELRGSRLAFAQGGKGEVRLVYLTPKIDVRFHLYRGEVVWEPAEMPFTFESAPLLVDNEFQSHFPSFLHILFDVNRSTACGKFASKFRSRRKPLPPNIANEVANVYEQFAKQNDRKAKSYIDAMPYKPPKIVRNRRNKYNEYLSLAKNSHTQGKVAVACKRKKKPSKSC